MKIALYHGDNGSHEFWEDKKGDYLLIRPHPQTKWVWLTYEGIVAPSMPVLNSPNIIEAGNFILDRSRHWKRVKPDDTKMRLVLKKSK